MIKSWLLALMLFMGGVGVVVAQATQLSTLKSDYFFQFEKYSQAADQFDFDRNQFRKLGNLASQEQVIVSLKSLMTYRAQTFNAYLAILDNLLVNTGSVDRLDKENGLAEIKLAQDEIKNHLLLLPNLSEKTQVLEESGRFETNKQQIFKPLYSALSLIVIGRVQSALDQTIVAASDFETEIVDPLTDENFKAANKRGLKEVGLLLTQGIEDMKRVRTTFAVFSNPTKTREDPEGVYKEVVNGLTPIHTNLRKAVDFLVELERGI